MPLAAALCLFSQPAPLEDYFNSALPGVLELQLCKLAKREALMYTDSYILICSSEHESVDRKHYYHPRFALYSGLRPVLR